MLYLVLAALFLALGLLGAVLPGLPTTPFLLLMSYFLARSSPRLHARMLAMPIVGGPLRDWQQQQGVRPSVKITAMAMVLAAVGAILCFSPLPWAWKCVVCALATIGFVVIWRLPTVGDPALARPRANSSAAWESL